MQPRNIVVNSKGNAAVTGTNPQAIAYAQGAGLDLDKATAILAKYRDWDNGNEALIPVLQEIQNDFGFVPDAIAQMISEQLGVPITRVYGVTTFYSDFRIQQKAAHRIMVCEGTACYVMGAQKVAAAVHERLGIEYGGYTPDREWVLERANFCFGACQLAPFVEVDLETFNFVTPQKINEIIDTINAGQDPHGEHHVSAQDMQAQLTSTGFSNDDPSTSGHH